MARNPNRFLATVQIGVTLSGFISAAYGAATIAPDVEPLLEGAGFGSAAVPASFIGMTLLVAYLSLVLGELVPKRVAMQSAGGFTKVLAPPLNILSEIMRPVIWLLSVSTTILVGCSAVILRETGKRQFRGTVGHGGRERHARRTQPEHLLGCLRGRKPFAARGDAPAH